MCDFGANSIIVFVAFRKKRRYLTTLWTFFGHVAACAAGAAGVAMIAAAAAAAGAKLQRRRGPSALGASVLTALLAGAAALWVLFDTRINDPTLAALLFGDSLDPVAFAPAGWPPR